MSSGLTPVTDAENILYSYSPIALRPIPANPPSRFHAFACYSRSAMATASQFSANQINSQLSTGPRTESGKAAASHNALKHGLTSELTVLPNEDQTEFDSLLERYRKQFACNGEHESFLVEQMARSRWKLARIQRLETTTFERASETGSADDWKALATLQRYSAAAERSYYRAHRELQQSRKEDPQVEHKQAVSLSNVIDAYINAPIPNVAKSASFRKSETGHALVCPQNNSGTS